MAFANALLGGSFRAADLLADLLVPPLAIVAVTTLAGLGVSLLAWWAGWSHWGALPWGLSTLALVVYIVQGIRLTGNPRAAVRALGMAPVYLVWKLLGWRRDGAAHDGVWVRTARATKS